MPKQTESLDPYFDPEYIPDNAINYHPLQRLSKDSGNWRTVIIGHGYADPKKLLENPLNWRIHTLSQKAALTAVIFEIGYIESVKVNAVTGHMVDGHFRVRLAIEEQEPLIPVEYVVLTPNQERIALASLDPIAELAVPEKQDLLDLLSEVNTGNSDLQQFFSDLSERHQLLATDDAQPPDDFDEQDENIATEYQCPKCAYQWSGKPK